MFFQPMQEKLLRMMISRSGKECVF